ncbi:hypothetical protein [Kitasatospora sp. NPDC101183]|uniref:hypothetical protein n=1 Tax=Kitasatospora sp. NPDC101183 TaxID=3364100 RepID=UPI003823B5EC
MAGLTALLVHRYTDVGAIGPLPDMYEPIWSDDKVTAAVAQGIAIVALSVIAARSAGRGSGAG